MSEELEWELWDVFESRLFPFPVYDHQAARRIVRYLLYRGVWEEEVAAAIEDSTADLHAWLGRSGHHMVGEWIIAWLNDAYDAFRLERQAQRGRQIRRTVSERCHDLDTDSSDSLWNEIGDSDYETTWNDVGLKPSDRRNSTALGASRLSLGGLGFTSRIGSTLCIPHPQNSPRPFGSTTSMARIPSSVLLKHQNVSETSETHQMQVKGSKTKSRAQKPHCSNSDYELDNDTEANVYLADDSESETSGFRQGAEKHAAHKTRHSASKSNGETRHRYQTSLLQQQSEALSDSSMSLSSQTEVKTSSVSVTVTHSPVPSKHFVVTSSSPLCVATSPPPIFVITSPSSDECHQLNNLLPCSTDTIVKVKVDSVNDTTANTTKQKTDKCTNVHSQQAAEGFQHAIRDVKPRSQTSTPRLTRSKNNDKQRSTALNSIKSLTNRHLRNNQSGPV